MRPFLDGLEVTRRLRRQHTRTELAILECLMRASGRFVPRDTLVEEVWGEREVNPHDATSLIKATVVCS